MAGPTRLSNSNTYEIRRAGALTAAASSLPMFIAPADGKIVDVRAYLVTAPTGATTFKVDINNDGTSIWSATQANRPIWVASANNATIGEIDNVDVSEGDVFTVDIDAVGSTVAGSDLYVQVVVE